MLALILSGIGIFIGVLNNRRERTIQTRLLAIEEERQTHQRTEARRARLRAFLQKSGRHDYHIVIRNEGEAVARDVQTTLDGKPLLEHPVIPTANKKLEKSAPTRKLNTSPL